MKSILKKARQGIKGNASSVSIGTEDSAGSPNTTQVSLSSSTDKFKVWDNNEAVRDDGDSSSSGPLSKLIPAKLKKRKKRSEAQQPGYNGEDFSRGRSLGIGDDSGGGLSPGEKELEDDEASLLTYDSDDHS